MSELVHEGSEPETLDLGFARLTPVGLEMPEELRFNDWKRIGDRLLKMEQAANWAIGDWLCYGERYRRDYSAAMELVDRTFRALRDCAYVASKVESATRVADLSWTHHRLVAPLDPAEQKRWLDECLRQGWSSRELEEALAEATPKAERPPALTVRAIGDLHDLCIRAAERAGLEPADWAAVVLEQAARKVLDLEAA